MTNEPKYRVRISIYEESEQTPEEPMTFTDEPLYSGAAGEAEMATQAYRTHRHFLKDLAANQ